MVDFVIEYLCLHGCEVMVDSDRQLIVVRRCTSDSVFFHSFEIPLSLSEFNNLTSSEFPEFLGLRPRRFANEDSIALYLVGYYDNKFG